jgi:membrane protein DedA with SNARE-associated domain/rhodanese-related sulfurtransferase
MTGKLFGSSHRPHDRDMDALIHIIEAYGLWVVFISVLLDQGGLPTPSYAPMIVTAALATNAHESLWPILLVGSMAAVLADVIWFAGGRRYGAQLLRLMCRLSISPDSCVGTTRRIYERFGAPSLMLAKYIPGFAAVSTTLAGQAGTSWPRFLVFDFLGSVLWVSGAVILGAVFHEAVEVLLNTLEDLGHIAILMLLVALALFLAYKVWQRHRFLREIRMTRISSDELRAEMQAMPGLMLVDVRSAESRARSGWIAGSINVRDVSELKIDPDNSIVVYCDCPNDASAAVMARKLKAMGFKHVRPLAGGIGAWRALGFPVELSPGP